jgi:hypothetical protein
MNRRQFLAGFAAALAVHKLPKQLPAAIAHNAFEAVNLANGGERLWVVLYEFDPFMRVSIDRKRMAIHITSSRDFHSIRDILWNYKPIGIVATINGHDVNFADYVERLYATA